MWSGGIWNWREWIAIGEISPTVQIEANNSNKRERIATEYVKVNFPASKYAKLMPATMPSTLPPVAIANYQPIHAPTFVGNVPMTSLLPYGVSVDFLKSWNATRAGDKKRRKKRECRQSYSADCRMAKTRLKKGQIRFCAMQVALLCDEIAAFEDSFLSGTDSRVSLLQCIQQCMSENFQGMG